MAELVAVDYDPFLDTMTAEEVRSYFGALFARLPESRYVPHEPFEGAEPGACHENAHAYVKANPSSSVCPGWLISGNEENGYTACHHAVVRLQNGDLIDVTPLPVAMRFLTHNGGNEDFNFLQEQHSQYRY
jgi:hypothetical protein